MRSDGAIVVLVQPWPVATLSDCISIWPDAFYFTSLSQSHARKSPTPYLEPPSIYNPYTSLSRYGLDANEVRRTPTKPLARYMLEHISAVDVNNAPNTPVRSFSQLLIRDREHDELDGLDPKSSIVEKLPEHIPAQPQTFVHRNSEAYESVILYAETNKSQQLDALRSFLDCFYAECAYVRWNMRKTRGDAQPGLLSDCLEHESYSEEEKKKSILLLVPS